MSEHIFPSAFCIIYYLSTWASAKQWKTFSIDREVKLFHDSHYINGTDFKTNSNVIWQRFTDEPMIHIAP